MRDREWFKTKTPIKAKPLIEPKERMQMSDLPELVPLHEAASYFKCSKSTIGNYSRRGLKTVRIGKSKFTTATWIAEFISGGGLL